MNNILEIVKNCIRRTTGGRVGRLGYLLSFIPYLGLTTIAPYELKGIVAVITLCLIFFVGAKRCHDIGLRGWWQLIPGFFVYLLFARGMKNNNRYGPAL